MTTISPPDLPRAEESQRGHLAYLDALRALAALYVVMHHAQRTAFPPDIRLTGLERMLVNWPSGGHWSVCLFIVLSGFCLMLPIVRGDGNLRGGVQRFFQRRAKRILPGYFCAVLLSLLLIGLFIGDRTGTNWDTSLPITPSGILLHLTLLHNLLPQTIDQINYPLWSVAVEWQIYFAFPILVWLWHKIGGVRTTVLATVIAYALVAILRKSPWIGITPHFYALFALGMLGAAVSFSKEARWTAIRDRCPWFVLALLLMVIVLIERHFPNLRLLDFVVGLSSMCLFIGCSAPRAQLARRILEWRPFVFIGTFSYSLYLIHAPILQLYWKYGVHPWKLGRFAEFMILETSGILFAILGSFIFFLVAERPFLKSASPGLVPAPK